MSLAPRPPDRVDASIQRFVKRVDGQERGVGGEEPEALEARPGHAHVLPMASQARGLIEEECESGSHGGSSASDETDAAALSRAGNARPDSWVGDDCVELQF